MPIELPSCLSIIIPQAHTLRLYYCCSDSGAMKLHHEIVRVDPLHLLML